MATLKKEDVDALQEAAWDMSATMLRLEGELQRTRKFLLLYQLARLWAWVRR